jgi:hypothetical protein
LNVFESGHDKSAMTADWQNIVRYVKKGMGQYLAEGLVKNGWVALYYNPDVLHPLDDDNEHPYSYNIAREKGVYGSTQYPPVIPVHDFVINYRPTPGNTFSLAPKNKQTTKDTSQTDKLKDVPFGFVMGRGGTHTALIIKGSIFEVHWDVGPFSHTNADGSPYYLFDTSSFENKWPWLSGLIVVPKNFWRK